MQIKTKIAIIGAGAAGLMAAYKAAAFGADVTVFEKNEMPGKKLLITGKGRCNVTNNSPVQEVMENIPVNPRFLYTALNAFTPQDTIDFFENAGVELKTERGNRVFPVSDKSRDIVNALTKEAKKAGAKFIQNKVSDVIAENGEFKAIKCGEKEYSFDRLIIATGGKSYHKTGSTGDGYKFAENLGIEIIPQKPSLVPIVTCESWCRELMGLSLRNVALTVTDTTKSKKVYTDFGEMLFTHFGVSGPMILSASSRLRTMNEGQYVFSVDLKPALDEKTLDNRIMSDFSKYANKIFANSLSDLLPSKLIPVIIRLSGIPEDKKVNIITKEERRKLRELIKNLTFTAKSFRPIDEAIITSGGISVKEIDPRTMQSKKIKGLYFAGEVIDVDAYTGGFNLQIAFSTAMLAAESAAEGIYDD